MKLVSLMNSTHAPGRIFQIWENSDTRRWARKMCWQCCCHALHGHLLLLTVLLFIGDPLLHLLVLMHLLYSTFYLSSYHIHVTTAILCSHLAKQAVVHWKEAGNRYIAKCWPLPKMLDISSKWVSSPHSQNVTGSFILKNVEVLRAMHAHVVVWIGHMTNAIYPGMRNSVSYTSNR